MYAHVNPKAGNLHSSVTLLGIALIDAVALFGEVCSLMQRRQDIRDVLGRDVLLWWDLAASQVGPLGGLTPDSNMVSRLELQAYHV